MDDVRIWPRALRAAEVAALYRCSTGAADITISGAGSYYYMPIWDNLTGDQSSPVAFGERSENESTPVRNIGLDFAGMQLARREGDCAAASLRGAGVGRTSNFQSSCWSPRNDGGYDTQAGPYFRSRRAAPGDGIIGPVSAGYWVLLHSTGAVTVKCLNPWRTVAFAEPPRGFDSAIFHKLDATVKTDTWRSRWTDVRWFSIRAAVATGVVKIAVRLGRPPRTGNNEGAVGIAFSSVPQRSKAGGQQARRLSIRELH